jgi:hypothetical protein
MNTKISNSQCSPSREMTRSLFLWSQAPPARHEINLEFPSSLAISIRHDSQ